MKYQDLCNEIGWLLLYSMDERTVYQAEDNVLVLNVVLYVYRRRENI
jgi:hypothetical protein